MMKIINKKFMNRQNILVGFAGLVLGGLIVWFGLSNFGKSNNQEDSQMDHSNMSGTMQGMTEGLSGKTGDEFDKAFITEMIIHHEGAVEMAKQALVNAKHQEIKDLAKAIVDAQTKEINQMKAWQTEWYGPKTPNTSITPTPTATPTKTNPTPTPTVTSTPLPPVSVSINNFAFGQATLTVKKGTKVTWTNQDSAPHTVTGDNGGPSSGTLNPGGSYSYTFNTIGTFNYHCEFHSGMTAKVIVTN